MNKRFRLHYYVRNGGDGSANVYFFSTEGEAYAADDEQQESGEGWGESSAGFIDLTLDDQGNLSFEEYRDTPTGFKKTKFNTEEL